MTLSVNPLLVFYFTIVIISFLLACTPKKSPSHTSSFSIPYEITDSDAKYRLPGKLVEISGLSCIDDSTIACVEDEEGYVYIFDVIKGKVDQRVHFGKDGDYEGVEFIDGDMYVLRSSGKLYEIQAFRADSQITVKHRTLLAKANNPEGLAYDHIHHRLLVASKGRLNDEKSIKNLNTIYAFDLETKKLLAEPVFSFSVDDIYTFLGRSDLQQVHDRATNFLLPGSIGILGFHPSGIAVHPLSGDIYMVTSKGNLLIILDHEGEIIYIRDLPEELFTKPEGITFLPNGDMLISNEGLDGIANIRRFNYIKQIE